FFFQAEDGIRDKLVTGVQTCALPISESALVVVSIAPIDFELRAELLIDSTAVVLKECSGLLVEKQVVHGSIGVESAWIVRRFPGIELQHFLRHGIKSTQGNNVPGERISHPVAIGELASGGGIENLIPQTSKGKIAVLHIRCGHRSELAGGLFLNQLLISEKEESLVAAVIEFGNHH